MEDANFVLVPFNKTLIAAIKDTYGSGQLPHTVLLNGSTGAVIESNAWGKTDVDDFNAYLATL